MSMGAWREPPDDVSDRASLPEGDQDAAENRPDPEEIDYEPRETTAWLLAGPLGSGKTLAAEIARRALEERGEMPHVDEFSNYVRWRYEAATASNGGVDDNSLGEWAAEMRDSNGRDYFAKGLASELNGPVPASTHVIVSGVRSPTTPPVFADHFDNVVTIALWALPGTRMRRVEESEDAFRERDRRELWEWECKDFYLEDDTADYIVPNNVDDEENLSASIRRVVFAEYDGSRDAEPFETPFSPLEWTRDDEVSIL